MEKRENIINNGEISVRTLYFRINFAGEIEEINVVNNDPDELIEVDIEEYRKMLEQCVNDNIELEKRLDRHYELLDYYGKNNNLERYTEIRQNLVKRLQKNFDFYWTLVTKYKGVKEARSLVDEETLFISQEYIEKLLKEVV